MRLIGIFILCLLFSSCSMFEKDQEIIATYKVSSQTNIEVSSISCGATTNDYTEIRKITPDENQLVKRIDGSYSGYSALINRINDTLFKITFTDTSVFKGMKRTFKFNLTK